MENENVTDEFNNTNLQERIFRHRMVGWIFCRAFWSSRLLYYHYFGRIIPERENNGAHEFRKRHGVVPNVLIWICKNEKYERINRPTADHSSPMLIRGNRIHWHISIRNTLFRLDKSFRGLSLGFRDACHGAACESPWITREACENLHMWSMILEYFTPLSNTYTHTHTHICTIWISTIIYGDENVHSHTGTLNALVQVVKSWKQLILRRHTKSKMALLVPADQPPLV